MTGAFSKGETYAIVQAMKASGNRSGIIAAWKNSVEQWAKENPADQNAQAVLAWLPLWKVRPFYTAEELAPMWPALAIAIGHGKIWPKVLKSAKRLEFELEYARLPSRYIFDKKYFIVERLHYWHGVDAEGLEHALNG